MSQGGLFLSSRLSGIEKKSEKKKMISFFIASLVFSTTEKTMNYQRRVYLSYSDENKTIKGLVMSFCAQLRKDGIDARMDVFRENLSEDQTSWAARMIRESKHVLMICDPEYTRRIRGTKAQWDLHLIAGTMIQDGSQNKNLKFVPVLLEGCTARNIPIALCGFPYHDLRKGPKRIENYQALLTFIVTGVRKGQQVPVPLGKPRPPPPLIEVPSLFGGDDDFSAAKQASMEEAAAICASKEDATLVAEKRAYMASLTVPVRTLFWPWDGHRGKPPAKPFLKPDGHDPLAEIRDCKVVDLDPDSPESEECVVCKDAKRTIALLPCRHRRFCPACVLALPKSLLCPSCRTPIARAMQMY